MGKSKPKRHRSEVVNFRATQLEKAQIDLDAEAAGMDAATWMRFRLLGDRVAVSGPERRRAERVAKAAAFVADLTPPAPRAPAPLTERDVVEPPPARAPVSVPPAATPSSAPLRAALEAVEPARPAAPAVGGGWFRKGPQ